MRIMHVITRREFRGAEVVARDLCSELAKRGHQVCLTGLFRPPRPEEANRLTEHLPDVIDLGGPQRRGFSLRIMLALRKAINQFRPDIVQANAFNALRFAALVRFLTRAKWPLLYRNVGIASQWITLPGQRLWGNLLLRQVDQVVSVSEESRDDFAATYRIAKSRIRVTRQGVSVPSVLESAKWRRQLQELIGCAQDDPLLVHVGNFAPEKNHIGLLESFSQILEKRPESHLVLMGDGPLRAQVESRIEKLAVGPSVHLLGTRADAACLVAGADLMLVSSHVEGIPGVVLESCARAVPVVATHVGGLGEIIQHGQTGLLVPKGDMPALAREALRLIRDAGLRQRLGLAAREFVKKHYSLDASVAECEEIYRSLLASNQASIAKCRVRKPHNTSGY